MQRRIAVRAIVLHEGKLLCVRQRPYSGGLTGKTNGYWNLPGGGLDEGGPLEGMTNAPAKIFSLFGIMESQ